MHIFLHALPLVYIQCSDT